MQSAPVYKKDNSSHYNTEVDASQNEIDTAKCKSCGHVLKEHYHLKSDGYGCLGNGENCACISFTVYGHANKNTLTLDDMWKFIDSILIPFGLMPEKANLTEEQVVKLYDELVAVDMQFKELEQIAVLKKNLDDLKET